MHPGKYEGMGGWVGGWVGRVAEKEATGENHDRKIKVCGGEKIKSGKLVANQRHKGE